MNRVVLHSMFHKRASLETESGREKYSTAFTTKALIDPIQLRNGTLRKREQRNIGAKEWEDKGMEGKGIEEKGMEDKGMEGKGMEERGIGRQWNGERNKGQGVGDGGFLAAEFGSVQQELSNIVRLLAARC